MYDFLYTRSRAFAFMQSSCCIKRNKILDKLENIYKIYNLPYFNFYFSGILLTKDFRWTPISNNSIQLLNLLEAAVTTNVSLKIFILMAVCYFRNFLSVQLEGIFLKCSKYICHIGVIPYLFFSLIQIFEYVIWKTMISKKL